MAKKIVIVGGGIAGLSAGCYARMNGYETLILEKHSLPGGLCTSWKRGPYTVDGCIHWLCGTARGSAFRKYWDELRALEGVEIAYPSAMTSIETGSGEDVRAVTFHADADRLNAHFREISPEDGPAIDEFTDAIKRFASFEFVMDKPMELMRMGDFVKMMTGIKPYMKDFSKLGKMTVGEYAKRFKSPHLREAITAVLDIPDFSLLAFIMMLGWQHGKTAGFPLGGSLAFAKRIERRYLALGGDIRYDAGVSKILTEGKRATGVLLEDGTEIAADYVVSAADGHRTLFGMLDGKYLDRKTRRLYEDGRLFEPFFCLSLGVNRDFSGEPDLSVRILREPITVEGKTHNKIGIKHYCFDPSLAPKGKSIIEIPYTADYDYWKRASADRTTYEAEKKRVADALISGLAQIYPGIEKDIEMTDAATPITWERYTGNRRGTFEGWLMTPKTMNLRVKKTVPGLSNFYMAGQWVQPGGGLPASMKSGRDAIYLITAKDKKAFVTAE